LFALENNSIPITIKNTGEDASDNLKTQPTPCRIAECKEIIRPMISAENKDFRQLDKISPFVLLRNSNTDGES